MIFCDTSAAAKLYVTERESPAVKRLLEKDDEPCLSELARVELMGVFHRRWREGKWSQSDFLAACRQFANDDDGGFWTWLPVERQTLQAASQIYVALPSTIFLRASDCLHLVTALQRDFSEILTYDAKQSTAASALGLRAVVA
jgi:predicted nucleic acid-binding protein